MFNKYFGDKKFWKTALRIAIPIAFQNILTSSFVLIDTLMVGQLGDVALASVGMAGQLSWLLNVVVFGISSGAAVFVAQFWGNKDYDGIHKTLGIAVVSATIISCCFLVVGFIIPDKLIYIFNKEREIVIEGSKYLKIACLSYPAVILAAVLSSVLRSTEHVKLPMYTALVTTVMNVFLDYSLIFGKSGMPELKIEGAAIATCISAWIGPLIMLSISFFEKNILIAPLKEIFGFDFAMVKRFYIKAFPVITNESLWGLGTLIYNVIFANTGYENFAALTIFRTFENFTFVFFIGLCEACCVMIGKNIGAGYIDEAVGDSLRFTTIIPAVSVFVGAFVIIFRKFFVGLFNTGNNISEYTVLTAQWLMIIYGCHIAFRNIPYIQIVGIFRSGGDTKTGMIYDIICLWFIALPVVAFCAYVLKLHFLILIIAMYVSEDYLKIYRCIKFYRSLKWIKPVTKEGKEGLEKYLKK